MNDSWKEWTKMPNETFEYFLSRDEYSYMTKITFKNNAIQKIELIKKKTFP